MELPFMQMVRTVSRPVWQDEEFMFGYAKLRSLYDI